mmetsp:Transcript_10387/g.18643  ORF Transcript_10387/g.18643 Transcript_10387/m.18643 type:complete len:674 (+) Transcript_10387:70-2091(+)
MGMGCATSAKPGGYPTSPPLEGEAEKDVIVREMPLLGGEAEAEMPDGRIARFMVPAGYQSGTKVRIRYKPLPPPKPKAKASPKAAPAPLDRGVSPAGSGAANSTSLMPPQASPAASSATSPPVNSGRSEEPFIQAASRQPSPAVSEDAFKGPVQVQAKIVHEQMQGLPLLPAQLPKLNGSWEWMRLGNDDVHRMTRQDAGELLRESFIKGGFCWKLSDGEVQAVKFKSVKQMLQGTRIISMGIGLPALPKDPEYNLEVEYGQGISCIEKAETLALQKPPMRPATINAASAFHAGGGFTTGGRHALEEAFCSQSTLYLSLEKAMAQFEVGVQKGIYRKDDFPGYHRHIPVDGCILSPNVEIFRGGTDQGYQAWTTTTPLAAVVSVAMYNKNSRVRDAPVDAPTDSQEYEKGVTGKFTAMLHAAALSGADCIIIPDVGCGVFQNDPTLCGRLLGQALHHYRTRFKRAVFTGNEKFFTAASQSLREAGTFKMSTSLTKRVSDGEETQTTDAVKQVKECIVCKRSLAGADFTSLALLVDTQHHSRKLQFLHPTCIKAVTRRKFPKKMAMSLPDITVSAKEFLRALDLDGNGCISKEEVKCICALLHDGDLTKDYDAFDSDFNTRWAAWDSDRSGDVSLAQITAEVTLGDNMPQSLIQFVQEQARRSGPPPKGGRQPS